MSSFEYEGKNVDKAIKKACEELNLGHDEINYEIIAYGSSGIFGLAGVKKARIRVNLPDKTEEFETEAAVYGKAEAYSADDEALQTSPQGAETGEPVRPGLSDDPSEIGHSVLQRIVAAIASDAEISVEADPDRILFKVNSGSAALLIGKKGQTLEAMQSLVDKIVNKHNNHRNNHKIRVLVDVEGYLENRKTNLEKLAMRLADKSKRIRKPISLGQLNAYDRRIVHLALRDDPGVQTKSRGAGYLRKLVIFPQKARLQRQQMNQ